MTLIIIIIGIIIFIIIGGGGVVVVHVLAIFRMSSSLLWLCDIVHPHHLGGRECGSEEGPGWSYCTCVIRTIIIIIMMIIIIIIVTNEIIPTLLLLLLLSSFRVSHRRIGGGGCFRSRIPMWWSCLESCGIGR